MQGPLQLVGTQEFDLAVPASPQSLPSAVETLFGYVPVPSGVFLIQVFGQISAAPTTSVQLTSACMGLDTYTATKALRRLSQFPTG